MMDKNMPPWFSGPPVAEKLNSWFAYLAERLPIAGLNTTILQTKAGRAINAQAGGSGIAVTFKPWKITVTNTGTTISPIWTATIRPGTINSLIPNNIFDGFTIGADGTYYVKATGTTDGTDVTDITMSVDTTAPDGLNAEENTAPLDFDDLIGMIVKSTAGSVVTNTIYQIRDSNLTATAIIQMLVTRVPPGPGEEPFVRWWKWSIAE